MKDYVQEDLLTGSIEFEESKGLKVSKPFESGTGDTISLVYLNSRKAILKDKKGDFVVILSGEIDVVSGSSTAKLSLGGLWDKLKKGFDFIKGLLGGDGPGAGCQQQTGNVEVNVTVSGSAPVNFHPNSINVNVQCTGPQ